MQPNGELDKCAVFPEEEMRKEQDGEEITVISKIGSTYKKKRNTFLYIYSGLCGTFVCLYFICFGFSASPSFL